jgi:putative flippase GtrA
LIDLRTLIRESAGYAAAGVVALALDVGLLALLVNVFDWQYLVAAATSFTAGGVLLYLICVRLVFRFRRVKNRAIELPTFVALGLIGLTINGLVIYFAVETAGLSLIPAKLVAAGCTFGINFVLRRLVLFTPSTVDS